MTDRSTRSPYAPGPGPTVNTATDRQLGFERGMVTAYLDVAIDAITHLQYRTDAGRAWIVSDGRLEEVLNWLAAIREEVLRKEKIDTRPVAPPPAPVRRLHPPEPREPREPRENGR